MSFTRRAKRVTNGTGSPFNSIDSPTYNQAAGDLIVVIVMWEDVDGTTTVSDVAGNTYTPGTKQQVGGSTSAWAQMFYTINCAGNANNIVTADLPNGSGYADIKVLPYLPAGTASFVAGATGSNTSGQDPSAGSLTAGDLGVMGVKEYAGTTSTPGTGWDDVDESSANATHAFDRIDSPGGSITATCTLGTAVQSATVAMTFADTVGGGDPEGRLVGGKLVGGGLLMSGVLA